MCTLSTKMSCPPLALPNPRIGGLYNAYHERNSLCSSSAHPALPRTSAGLHSPNTVGSLSHPHSISNSISPQSRGPISQRQWHWQLRLTIPWESICDAPGANQYRLRTCAPSRRSTHPRVNTFSSDVLPHAPSPLQHRAISNLWSGGYIRRPHTTAPISAARSSSRRREASLSLRLLFPVPKYRSLIVVCGAGSKAVDKRE